MSKGILIGYRRQVLWGSGRGIIGSKGLYLYGIGAVALVIVLIKGTDGVVVRG